MNRSKPIAVAFLLFLATALSSFAVPGDEHWDSQFGWAGPAGNNFATATHKGRIYVSGLGANTNVAVQVWNGTRWSPMGQFYGTVPTLIFDLAFVGDTLYATGFFTNVDGVAANGVARWDGNAWSGVGFKGSGYCLAVDGSNLYVGGIFTTNLAGLPMKNIGRWDGTNWSALGSGLGDTNLTGVTSLAASNGIVYAGGTFNNSGAVAVTNLARWDGANWSPLGNGPNGSVASLALNGTDLYAGGLFGTAAVTHWDGANWTPLGGGFNAAAQNIAVFNNLVLATGSFTNTANGAAVRFAAWNGSTWSAAGSGLSANGNRICPNGTNVYVAGNFLIAGGGLANGFAIWDGTNWSILGEPGRYAGLNTSIRAIAGSGTNIYVAGAFVAAGPTAANLVARFDGSNWFPLGSGLGPVGSPTIINAIAVTNNDVYVGGYFQTAGGSNVNGIAHWDGTNWSDMGNPGGRMVYCINVQPDGVYAGGTDYDGHNYGSQFLSRWNGTNWQGVLHYDPTNYFVLFPLSDTIGLNAVAFMGTNLFVGGHINLTLHDDALMNFTNCANILRFDGTYARIMGSGVNSNVNALAVMGNDLYVAGPFTNADGVKVSGIARWNNDTWYDVGGGIVGRGVINTLFVDGSNLYAGGSFTNLGGVPVARVARWDGNNWSAFGSGISGSALGLDVTGPDLYVGGTFTIAGGKSSRNLARWNIQSNFNVPQLINAARLANGQFGARLISVSGVTSVVEYTTNFSSWTPLLTNSTGGSDFADPNSTGTPAQFYRAVSSQ